MRKNRKRRWINTAKSIIESIREFLLKCPYLDKLSRINVDFLPENPDTYSIERVPAPEIVKTYLDGSSERQVLFVFASRLFYSEELRNNIDNSGFYEAFSEWLEQMSEDGEMPDLGSGKTASKVEALSSGYLFGIADDFSTARYQIQCKLTYDKE